MRLEAVPRQHPLHRRWFVRDGLADPREYELCCRFTGLVIEADFTLSQGGIGWRAQNKLPAMTKSFANSDVLAFYRELPFNYRESADKHAQVIRDSDAIASSYPVLAPLLRRGGRFSMSAAAQAGSA